MDTALIVVDVQVDFCPGGALAVAGGEEVVDPANALIDSFTSQGLPVYITRDWHPANHCSFEEFGGTWPPHCVQGTQGARFHSALRRPRGATIISKATSPEKDAYSDFEGTNLARQLRDRQIDRIVVVGLATDYCVKATVLDGLREGFGVTVVPEGIRAVNVEPGDGDNAIREMKDAGASFENLEQVLAE